MKCIIIDDEELARVLMRKYITKVEELELIGEFKNPLELLNHKPPIEFDLVFLDIQMPELTGLEFLRTWEKIPYVIFTTAYSEYALEGFNFNVLDYLLKPIKFERFLQAIHKVWELDILKTQAEQARLKGVNKDESILVSADHKIHRIKLKDILYIQSLREYVAYYFKNGKRLLSLYTMRKLERELPTDMFMRVHKSFIVSRSSVTAIGGKELHLSETVIPIGSSYKAIVQKTLFRQ